MKKKIISVFMLSTLFSLFTNSCKSQSTITVKKINLNNQMDGYELNNRIFDVYFNKETNDLPYISIQNLYQTLDGYYDYSKLAFITDESSNNFTVSTTYDDEELKAVFNWESDEIYFNDYDFIDAFIKESSSIDYSYGFKVLDNSISSGGNSVTFKLKDYNFDIIHYENECLVPLVIANLVLNSTSYLNLIYNGDEICSYMGSISPSSTEDTAYEKIYTSSLNGTLQTDEMRNATINSLYFLIDYFYGLKDIKGINKAKDFIQSNYLDSLKLKDTLENNYGLGSFLLSQLDEGHTAAITSSVYAKYNKSIAYPENKSVEFNKAGNLVRTLTDQLLLVKIEESLENYDSTKVRYNGDTAIFTLKSFTNGTNEQIYDTDGKIKDTAWEYDTYYYMKHQLDEILTHTDVTNVVIDLSQNGGGSVAAMYRALGFLNNKDVRHVGYNTLTGRYVSTHIAVNVTGKEDDYTSNPYSKYNYSVLTSAATFSAANRFASIVKEQNLGKVIGKQSGGGMCSVLPTVLADGTFLSISSPNTLRITTDENDSSKIQEIESGIPVDAEFKMEGSSTNADDVKRFYESFFDNDEITALAKKAWSSK